MSSHTMNVRERVVASRQMAARVRRYHTWPMITQQTVGQASARVATIYVEVFGLPRAEVLLWCLHHDDGELSAGDVPFGGKKLVAGLAEAHAIAERIGLERLGVHLPELTDKERAQAKIADLLEMWETGVVELNMGNLYAGPIVEDTRNTAFDLANKIGTGQSVWRWFNDSRAEMIYE